jgi:fibronectin-binding autotransporter adhesin
MANKYVVGGSPGFSLGWDSTSTAIWSDTSGGPSGAFPPSLTDDVFIDANSGSGFDLLLFISVSCKSITISNATFNFYTGGNSLSLYGDFTIVGTPPTFGVDSGVISFEGGGPSTITTSGAALGNFIYVQSRSVTLGDALNTGGFPIYVLGGEFHTNNYSVTASQLWSSNSIYRVINLGSSVVTLAGSTVAVDFSSSANLVFSAGTSQLICQTTAFGFSGGNQTFHDVSFTSASSFSTMSGNNTFNNLSVAGRTSAGVSELGLSGNQTINGTLTLSPGTNATMRTFVRSSSLGTTRTLTCNAVAPLTDIDFRDITIAGAAAPVSGTRLGDCKGNSGITFDAAKTVYWIGGSNSWGSTNRWATSSGGVGSTANFPLAQDTAVLNNTSFANTTGKTATVNAAYNIGTIDMSGLTLSNTLATGTQTPAIYGNWINGTGTTLTGTGTLTFAGRGSQTITSAGKTFTQSITINTPGGSVTLQSAFTSNRSATSAFLLLQGIFDANGYAFTLSGSLSRFDSSTTTARTIAVGSGTWTIAGSGTPWNATTSNNLTVTGAGTIRLTSASAKTFAGGGIQTYPTLNQGGTGTLTVTGNNKFAGLTNTAIGSVLFTGGTTNEFTAFNLNGTSTAARLTVGSTNTTQAILKKPTAWNVGAGSLDGGNNTGLTFTAGGNDFLSLSYINGQLGSAGSYMLSALAAALLFTGASANALAGRIVQADPVAYVYNGSATTGTHAYPLTADAGSYAASVSAAALSSTRLMTGLAGEVSLDGGNAGFLLGIGFEVQGGAFTSSGGDSTSAYGRAVSSEAGDFALAGQVAGTLYTRIMPLAQGDYALAGSDAGLAHGYTVALNNGAFASDSASAGLLAGRIAAASVGDFALDGSQAFFGRGFLATSGSFALAGSNAASLRGYAVQAQAGAIAETGSQAFGIYTRIFAAGSGAYALAGQAAGTYYGRAVQASASAFALNGSAATVLYGRRPISEAGQFVMAGQLAAFLRDYRCLAANGPYDLAGYDIEMRTGVFIPVPDRTLLVEFENRTLAVGQDARAYAESSEPRLFTVPAEDRTFRASDNWRV